VAVATMTVVVVVVLTTTTTVVVMGSVKKAVSVLWIPTPLHFLVDKLIGLSWRERRL
jgi:hypothetical protein